ncbi:hypothetical protein M3Y95_01269500 [Aphelenchoides besseyi]|nr:hypothetical protein M3Y95_01269500 [Aphelenchoides besseyi]
MLSNSTLQQILYIEWGSEILLGIPSFFINIYTALRMSQLATFNINLKFVLCATSLSAAILSFLHPTIQAVPRSEYLVENKRYKFICFMYFLQYISHSLNLMANLKFLVIAIERKVAFNRRRFYEHTHETFGKWLTIWMLLFCFVIVALKVLFFLFLPYKQTLDDRLRDGFFLEGNLYYYIFAYMVVGICYGYGIYEFNSLKQHAKLVRFTGNSLSERYEIKQTRDVVIVMRTLLKAFGLLYGLANIVLLVQIYFYFRYEQTENTLFYHAMANIAFILIHIYNLFFATYMLWYFQPMRRMILGDLFSLCGVRERFPRIVPIGMEQTQDQHFHSLTSVWEKSAV